MKRVVVTGLGALTPIGNTLEAYLEGLQNGVSGANPVCGIFVAYGEGVEIAHNCLVDNGPLTPDVSSQDLIAGRRGGIVLNLVANFNLLDARALAQGDTFNARPAARIHENLVDQPVGLALHAIAFGPLQCTDNVFSSELSGLSIQERMAGTVFIYDLGGVNQAAAGMRLQRASTLQAAEARPQIVPEKDAAAPVSESAAVDAQAAALHAAPAMLLPQRAAAVEQLFPAGKLMFNDNQSRTGQSNTSASCQLLATLDDLAYQNNQSFSLRSGNLITNALLYGNTLRATGNRLGERGAETLLSLLSLGVRLNNTSFNQGDHCIVANDMNPAMAEVKVGNQILNPGSLCASRSIVAAILFKPHG